MRGRLVRALGVTALVFAGCFAVVLGVLVFGEPGVPSLGGNRIALVEVEGLIVDADRRGAGAGRAMARTRRSGPSSSGSRARAAWWDRRRRSTTRSCGSATRGKPVVASMGSVAASGGYYLAAAATRIVANPGTLTGSIGVIMQLAEIEGLLKKVGVDYVVIKAGQLQGHRNVRPPDDAGGARASCRRSSTTCTTSSSTAVAEGRGLGEERVRALRRRAGVLGTAGASSSGSSTRSGGLDEAIRRPASWPGIPGKPQLVRPRRTGASRSGRPAPEASSPSRAPTAGCSAPALACPLRIRSRPSTSWTEAGQGPRRDPPLRLTLAA